MGVQAGVIVNIHTGDWRQAAHAIGYLLEQFTGFAVLMLTAWPAAVVIELVVETAQAMFCCTGVSD